MNFTNYFAKIKTKIEVELDLQTLLSHILEGSRATAFYTTKE